MKRVTNLFGTVAVLALSGASATASADVTAKPYKVVSIEGKADQCITDLEISNMNPIVGSIVYLSKDNDGSLVFTDSAETTDAFVLYPIGHKVANPGLGGGPQVVYDSAYSGKNTLVVKESDSDGKHAVVTLSLSDEQIQYNIQETYSNSTEVFTGSCALTAVN